MKTNEKPQLQDFHIEGVKHIIPEMAFEAIKNNQALLIDVREESEVKLEYIPLDNVLNHPMSVIMERLPYIAKDQNIILGCPGGVRSSKVANLLNLQGYTNVANLDGGFSMWKAKGFPLESNLSSGIGCGCACTPASGNQKEGCC
jgi:rhodanese-related sulfurtransferase